MNFGAALELLKDNKKVARKGWNGKGMYLWLFDTPKRYKAQPHWEEKPVWYGYKPEGLEIVEEAYSNPLPIVNGNCPTENTNTFFEIGLHPFIVMKTADNQFVPWLASQTDILAEDWNVVE